MGEQALSLDDVTADTGVQASERLAEFDISDVGDPDSLCATILELTVEHKYDLAISALRSYQEMKDAYPQYHSRTFRYFDHCV